MTVCYAYEYEPCASSDKPCMGCGHYYWEHSHWLQPHGARGRRFIITKYGAMDHYDWHHATREPGADVRPRYQMMMDRQPGACAWVAAGMRKEMIRAWIDEDPNVWAQYYGKVTPDAALVARAEEMAGIAYTETEQFQSFAGDIDEPRPTYEDTIVHPATQAEIDVYGIPEEPAEITTWSDMMARQRRYLMPDGTTKITYYGA